MLWPNHSQWLPRHIELGQGLVLEGWGWEQGVGGHVGCGPQVVWLCRDGHKAIFTAFGGPGKDPVMFKVSLMVALFGLEVCYDSTPHFSSSFTCPSTCPIMCMSHITHPKASKD